MKLISSAGLVYLVEKIKSVFATKDEVTQGLSNKSNIGHTHSAADVGARPNTWNPGWSDIENKPDTFNPVLGETTSTAYRGDRGKIAYDHSQTAHAPLNAQKNSDITKAEIEAKLIGTISTHTHNTATNSVDGLMSSTDKTKLDGIVDGANNYVHPTNHPASIITQDTNNRFVTDVEKATWDAKETTTGAQAKATKALTDAKSYADQQIAALVDGAPDALNTLKELSDAITEHEGVYEAYVAQVSSDLAKKSDISYVDGTFTKPTGTIVANRVATFSDTTGRVIKDSGFTIATSVPANAKFTDTVYTHPSTHAASMITFTDGQNFQQKLDNGSLVGPQGPKGDSGSAGAQGEKGDTGAKGISMRLKGVWSSSVSYVNDTNYIDLVTSGGNTYACKVSNINQPVSNSSYWELIAQKGDTGATGDTGPKGADGLTTSVTVGSTKYTHSNGNITIPAYPTLSSLGAASTSVATTSANGLMSSTDKTKLNGIATGANNYVHPGSGTNPHGTTKADVGLGNVNNWGATTAVNSTSTTTYATASAVKQAYDLAASKADASHGNHVPTVQTASNKVFLRNDNTWQTITPDNIGAARGYRTIAATAATAGWYRIAQSGADITNNTGIFMIRAAASGYHSSTIISTGITYGRNPYINQLAHTAYTGTGISKARIVYHSTYSGNRAYLEVYVDTDLARTIEVQLFGALGWSLLTPSTVGSIPTGYSNSEITLAVGKIIANLNGNSTSATKLETSRSLTIGNTAKSFNGTANVSWTLAEIGAASASQLNGISFTVENGDVYVNY